MNCRYPGCPRDALQLSRFCSIHKGSGSGAKPPVGKWWSEGGGTKKSGRKKAAKKAARKHAVRKTRKKAVKRARHP